MLTLTSWLIGLLALAGIGYTIGATRAVAALGRRVPVLGAAEPVSLLKPLHGMEPRLAKNLATFLDQDWDASIQMVAGVQRVDDPALAAVGRIGGAVTTVVDATRHGANAKVGNLINMLPAAAHDLLVLSDSDMAVPRDYLARVAGALAEPGVGAVTCLYRGRADAGGWSVLAAAAISYQFLPSVVLGMRLGLAHPCMGSTIALRRGTLEAIGGFAPFVDQLADDYAIGEAVRALGLRVAVPPMVVVHGCPETSLAALWRHERRWAATIRLIDPAGHAGMIVTYPTPFALALIPFAPLAGLILLIVALAARWMLMRTVDRVAEAVSAPAWMLPIRDCLSFAVFIASFVARSVDWRGSRLRMAGKGRIAAATESRR